ncbi:MAG: DUF934 domain-containing protein [Cellvibrionaceae bacterium]
MPNKEVAPKQIIKDGKVIDNEWQLLSAYEDASTVIIPQGKVIVHLDILQQQNALSERSDTGVLINNDVELSEIAEKIVQLPLIAIDFPVFMDGRGFSLARVLRERYQYQGEIRAVGHVIRDQLCYLQRCGFNAFSFDESVDLDAALASLSDFTEAYQTSVEKPEPLFRRRA